MKIILKNYLIELKSFVSILNIESNIIITKPQNSRPNVTVTVTVVLDINYIASLNFKVLPLFFQIKNQISQVF